MMRSLLLVAALGVACLSAPSFAMAQEHVDDPHAVDPHAGHAHAVDAHGDDAHAVDAHAVDAHGDDAHGAHHEATFADIDPVALGGGIVNFALLLIILFFLMRKSLPEFLSNRRAAVVDGMEEARRLKAEADVKYAQYSERIDNLDAELERLREELRRSGMDERDRIVADASRKAEKMREEARFLIDQQMKQLRQDLTREAIEAAVAAAELVLTQGTTPQDQERLAKDYLGTIRTTVVSKTGEKSL